MLWPGWEAFAKLIWNLSVKLPQQQQSLKRKLAAMAKKVVLIQGSKWKMCAACVYCTNTNAINALDVFLLELHSRDKNLWLWFPNCLSFYLKTLFKLCIFYPKKNILKRKKLFWKEKNAKLSKICSRK